MWRREENGKRILFHWSHHNHFLFEFEHPKSREMPVNMAVDVAETGLYDGVFFDHWSESASRPEVEKAAMVNILRKIRDAVSPEFLILGNANVRTLPRSAPYMNGIMMEAVGYRDRNSLFNQAEVKEIESVLTWADRNMRQPTINALGILPKPETSG